VSRILHPWSVEPMSVNHAYQVVVREGERSRVVAQRLRKADADRIVLRVNGHADTMARAAHAEERLRELEEVIRRLRAYIRDNEVKTLRGIKVVQSEPI